MMRRLTAAEPAKVLPAISCAVSPYIKEGAAASFGTPDASAPWQFRRALDSSSANRCLTGNTRGTEAADREPCLFRATTVHGPIASDSALPVYFSNRRTRNVFQRCASRLQPALA